MRALSVLFCNVLVLASLACGGGGGGSSAPSTGPSPTPPPTYAAFVESGALSTNRSAFCATLLLDGRVLVTGGYNATQELDSAEIFTPSANGGLGGFTLLNAHMSVTRYRHTATLLPSGKVLITGGRDGSFASRQSAELFDPLANGGAGGFQSLSSAMTVARAEHVALALKDGRVLITGGSSGNIQKTAEIFDPNLNTFTATNGLHYVRIHHTATLLDSGKVLITGGDQGGMGNSAELFDPAADGGKGSFSDLPPMSISRYFHQAALLKSGQVLIAGGSNGGPIYKADLFDPLGNAQAGTILPTADMAAGRALHTLTSLNDGRCLVAGGAVTSNTGLDSRSTEWFDPTMNAGGGGYRPGPTLLYARSGHVALRLADQTILILGGGQIKAEVLR